MAEPGFINLQATLDSGQLFSHQENKSGEYDIPINGFRVRVSEKEGRLDIRLNGCNRKSVHHFFDLDYDLQPVHEALLQDAPVRPAVEAFPGLRLLNQDRWEAFVCFILSANNNIQRIKKMRNNLVCYFSPDTPLVFPSYEIIARSDESALRSLGLGYRAPYLLKTCRMLADSPELIRDLSSIGIEDAVNRLIQFPGVGPKVADCILLYGFHRLEVFPMDVWMIRVMKSLYFRKRKTNERKMRLWALKRWGNQSGYVQQYLFHGVRTGLIQI